MQNKACPSARSPVGRYPSRPRRDLADTTCCYARSTKAWIADPDGVPWEAFLTTGAATVYGDDESLDELVVADTSCCGGDAR